MICKENIENASSYALLELLDTVNREIAKRGGMEPVYRDANRLIEHVEQNSHELQRAKYYKDRDPRVPDFGTPPRDPIWY